MTNTQIRLRTTPAFTISRCLIAPVPKTIAFGGVATGSIKAQLAPKPMISAKPISGIPSVWAIVMKIGTSNAALAVLLVNSVKKIMNAATIKPIM